MLQAVIPVCAGINLEYYFSYVDPTGYGCGTKLPHNITSLLGVMDGAASDLRPGLPWQMVEIHEPMRILFVVETTPEAMLGIMARDPAIGRLVRNGWVQLATLDPDSPTIHSSATAGSSPTSPRRRPAGRAVLAAMVSGLARSPGICLDRARRPSRSAERSGGPAMNFDMLFFTCWASA